MLLALSLCDHDLCCCGVINLRGEVIGADLPADLPPDPAKEVVRVVWVDR